MPGKLRHLIVYAHPNPESFNHALLVKVQEAAVAAGHEVTVYDLYHEGFAPARGHWDDQHHAEHGCPPGHADDAQKAIVKSDHITFIFPIWWTGMPAILKGWVDRTLTTDFAYHIGNQGPVGLLDKHSVMLITTHGMPASTYEGNGMYDAIKKTQDVGIFEFCGMKVKKHLFFGGVHGGMTPETAAQYLQAAADAVKALTEDD